MPNSMCFYGAATIAAASTSKKDEHMAKTYMVIASPIALVAASVSRLQNILGSPVETDHPGPLKCCLKLNQKRLEQAICSHQGPESRPTSECIPGNVNGWVLTVSQSHIWSSRPECSQTIIFLMACSVPHTYDEIKAMVEKQIEEDKARHLAVMNLAIEYDNACGAKDDLRKAYEECNHIPQETRVLIDTFLKEGSNKD
ncbi:hypothetical protein Tco_0949951 [Tanacetum coccineum]